MIPALETYIERYYNDWLQCSRRSCSALGIRQEAEDILADVLESFCRRSEERQLDMLAHEQAGDPKLFFYIRKAIHIRACLFRKNVRISRSIDEYPYLPCLREQEREEWNMDEEQFVRFRNAEAKLRADDYIDPELLYDGHSHINRYVLCSTSRVKIVYTAFLDSKRKRNCGRYSSAVAFLRNQRQMQEIVNP